MGSPTLLSALPPGPDASARVPRGGGLNGLAHPPPKGKENKGLDWPIHLPNRNDSPPPKKRVVPPKGRVCVVDLRPKSPFPVMGSPDFPPPRGMVQPARAGSGTLRGSRPPLWGAGQWYGPARPSRGRAHTHRLSRHADILGRILPPPASPRLITPGKPRPRFAPIGRPPTGPAPIGCFPAQGPPPGSAPIGRLPAGDVEAD